MITLYVRIVLFICIVENVSEKKKNNTKNKHMRRHERACAQM